MTDSAEIAQILQDTGASPCWGSSLSPASGARVLRARVHASPGLRRGSRARLLPGRRRDSGASCLPVLRRTGTDRHGERLPAPPGHPPHGGPPRREATRRVVPARSPDEAETGAGGIRVVRCLLVEHRRLARGCAGRGAPRPLVLPDAGGGQYAWARSGPTRLPSSSFCGIWLNLLPGTRRAVARSRSRVQRRALA